MRKVTERKDIVDCSDPWLVPKSMVIPKRKGPLYGKDDKGEFTVYVVSCILTTNFVDQVDNVLVYIRNNMLMPYLILHGN